MREPLDSCTSWGFLGKKAKGSRRRGRARLALASLDQEQHNFLMPCLKTQTCCPQGTPQSQRSQKAPAIRQGVEGSVFGANYWLGKAVCSCCGFTPAAGTCCRAAELFIHSCVQVADLCQGACKAGKQFGASNHLKNKHTALILLVGSPETLCKRFSSCPEVPPPAAQISTAETAALGLSGLWGRRLGAAKCLPTWNRAEMEQRCSRSLTFAPDFGWQGSVCNIFSSAFNHCQNPLFLRL